MFESVSAVCLNDSRRTTDNFLNHPTGNLRDSQTQAYGLAELFASDPTAKRLVLQLPLNTYVPVEALSLRWGSDKRLVGEWLRANSDAVRRLGVHTKQFYEKKTRTKAIVLGGPNSDPPESRRVGGVAAPAPLHAVSCVGPTAANTKRVEAWSQKPAPPAESTSRKSARGAADQRAAWSSTLSPLDADPRPAQRRNDAVVADGGGVEAHAGAGAALEQSGPSSVAEPWRKHDAQDWHARYAQQHDLAREAVEGLADCRHRHAKPSGDIHRTRFAVFGDQFVDQLDIILGQLIATCFAHALKRLRARICGAIPWRGACVRAGYRHSEIVAWDGLTSKVVGQIVSIV